MATFILSRQARDRAQVTRYAIGYAVLILVLCTAQTTVGARERFFGAVPDLCIAGTLCIAWYCGKEAGGVFGILVGLCAEIFGTTGVMILPVCYFLFGYASGVYARRMEKNFLIFAVFAVIAAPARLLMSVGYEVLFEIQALPHRIPVLLAEAASATFFSLLLYLPVGWLSRRMSGEKKRKV